MRVDHPGVIVFEDENKGTAEDRNVNDVPESIAWAATDQGPVAVVRVVSRLRGRSREIQSFGPDGQLLRTTISHPR